MNFRQIDRSVFQDCYAIVRFGIVYVHRYQIFVPLNGWLWITNCLAVYPHWWHFVHLNRSRWLHNEFRCDHCRHDDRRQYRALCAVRYACVIASVILRYVTKHERTVDVFDEVRQLIAAILRNIKLGKRRKKIVNFANLAIVDLYPLP